jgi:hypothetical protein
LVHEQASDFVDELEDEFGFLGDAGNAAEGARDAVADVGSDAQDEIEDLF